MAEKDTAAAPKAAAKNTAPKAAPAVVRLRNPKTAKEVECLADDADIWKAKGYTVKA